MPYLDVVKKQGEQINSITVPNVTGMNLQEAKKVLNEVGLKYEIQHNSEENAIENPVILDQLPKQGISIQDNTKMILYID